MIFSQFKANSVYESELQHPGISGVQTFNPITKTWQLLMRTGKTNVFSGQQVKRKKETDFWYSLIPLYALRLNKIKKVTECAAST